MKSSLKFGILVLPLLVLPAANGFPHDCPSHLKSYSSLYRVYQHKCFMFEVQRRANYDDAARRCEHLGGTLALVKSSGLQDFIFAKLLAWRYSYHVEGAWIGLSDKQTETEFVWEDGSPLGYSHWRGNGWGLHRDPQHAGNHEMRDCVFIGNKAGSLGKWYVEKCDGTESGDLKPYICQFHRDATLPTTTLVPTTTPQVPTTTTQVPTTTTQVPTSTTQVPTSTTQVPTTTTQVPTMTTQVPTTTTQVPTTTIQVPTTTTEIPTTITQVPTTTTKQVPTTTTQAPTTITEGDVITTTRVPSTTTQFEMIKQTEVEYKTTASDKTKHTVETSAINRFTTRIGEISTKKQNDIDDINIFQICSPFTCGKDCGLDGYQVDTDGCSVCECNA